MYEKHDNSSSWRPYDDEIDSGNESHPLLSSGTSHTSRASFGAIPCMFPDSETSDFEAPPRAPVPVREKQQQFSNPRRPFHYQNAAPQSTSTRISQVGKNMRGAWDDQMSAMTYNRFQYYSKLRAYTPDQDRVLVIPDHIIPSSFFLPYIPGGPDQDSGKQSSIVTIFAIWNTIMGSSILTMPWGVERSGLATAVLLMILMGTLCLYTTYRILQVQKTHGNNIDGEASDLCRQLLGRSSEMIAKFFSMIVLLGANIVYWILMSNFLFHSVDYLYDRITGVPLGPFLINGTYTPAVVCPRHADMDNATSLLDLSAPVSESVFHQYWKLYGTVPIVLILIIAPLVNFKSATFFTKFNSLGTLSVMYLLVFVLTKASKWGINVELWDRTSPVYTPAFLPSFPALSGMLALSFFIHNIVITIMRNNRHQENNGRDLSVAYVLVTMTYIIIGTVFYVSFPLTKSCIEDNLLNNFPDWDVMTVVARVFLFFQLVTVYPLIAYMLRVQMFKTLMQNIYPSFSHVAGLNAIIIFICVLFAIYLPRIGTIIRFTGALAGMIYVFTLPCLLHLASLRKQGRMTACSVLVHLLIPLVGGANLAAQFFISEH